jgi:hypothetical protein
MMPPASRNLMVNKNKGSADRRPNFPAVDADAHRNENSTPMSIFLSNDGNL